MLKRIVILASVVFWYFNMQAQDTLQSTIVLIGDAGELTKGHHPVVNAARRTVPMNEKTTIIYLGDNLYKTGLPDNSLPTYDIAKAPLDSQIHISGTAKTNVYFIPGNHDWANGGRNGYESVLRVQSYIDFLSNNYVKMYPRDGCAGPVEAKITDDIVLVMMDSQWWIHEFDKPGVESDCPYKTKAEILTQLEDILARNSKKLVLFATHHPFRSYGPHGGYFTLKQHIFPFTDVMPSLYIPLPIIGSSYPLTRAVFGTTQDLKHPLYQAMIHAVEPIIKQHPNVIYLAGHEHTMQLIQDSGYNYIVSGSGAKSNRVSKSKNTLFATPNTGFATLQVSKNKIVRASFYSVDGDSVNQVYTKNILDFSKIPVKPEDTMRHVEYAFEDSVVISASDKYKKHKGFSEVFLGKNYRKEWSMPVSLKVFNIRKEMGGFEIKSLGGGKQTKSLRIADKNGKEWNLRMIDKDPEKAIPENLRGTLAQDLVEDMISASDPYSPLIVPTLARAAKIPSTEPRYFFVPDDPALGYYRTMFANKVVMLEDRDPVPGSDTKSTSKVLNKLYEDNDHKINQPEVLKARLLDMLIGDFDRHADQWKWGTDDTGKGKLYYPVPRDRDQAFFYSDGLLVKFLSKNRMRFLEGFNPHIDDINGLNYVAKDFDRVFLNAIDEASWKAITDSFAMRITDKVIDESVTKYPREIAPISAARAAKRLKTRRNELTQNSLRYYRFISKEVSVIGSNEPEYFHITNDNGQLKLSVYKKNDRSDSASLAYRRSFDPGITKELRLYGLNGDDKFEVDPDVSSRIKLRIVGGKGKDSFNLQGKLPNFLYDLSSEKNVFINTNGTNKELSPDVAVLEYKNTGFEYNQFIFPRINIGINAEDGFLVGLGGSWRTYGFRNEPYATDQKLSTLFAPGRGNAYQAKYRGEFNKVLFKNDLVVNAEFVNPTLNNFFGMGNSTEYDKSLKMPYYRVRYKYVQADLLLRKRMNDIFHLSAGPTYYRYWSDFNDNKDRILSKPSLIGSDSTSLYSIKDYLGVKARMDISYINNELFPSRGITWFTEFSSLFGMNDNSKRLNKVSSDMTIYATVSDKSRITTVMRFGGGHIFNNNYEFFQAFNLGANNYVRGYRKNRFSGSSMAYASTELRLKLFKSTSYILPGDIGIMGFFDIGRVWVDNEASKKWHNSTGGGIYFVPFNVVMLSATVGISEEDRLFNFTIGTKFNLTF